MRAARAVGLLLGAVADAVIGDSGNGDSVRGRAVTALAATVREAPADGGRSHRARGAGPACALAGTAVLAGWGVERAARGRPLVTSLGTAAATWLVLGGARLATDGTALARSLETGALPATRRTLAAWDPRRTDDLDATALARASVETVAEHTANTVVAPLLWGAVAGVPGLFGARALSLVCVPDFARDAPPRRAGWALARLGEVVTLVPTRVTAACTVAGAPVVGGSARASWRAWRRDTVLHPSPNAGRVEAAFAGALQVRLGGRTPYPRGVRELPVLGDGRNPDAGHVTRAVELSRVVGWLATATTALLALLAARRRTPSGSSSRH